MFHGGGMVVKGSAHVGLLTPDHVVLLCFAFARYVASGPMVRSSYKAGEFFMEAMIKADRGLELHEH